MYLKQLTLQGFKSFVDRTAFDFSGGITAVVGPNGCGKSNLVDALKWIFGERSAKDLRGQEMKDVIFAGSDTRRPLGFAEVFVVFDNSDGVLPSDRVEVSVTRRLFRSGESDYRINGGKCRLRDILDIFADTGIGTESYSILEQGKIDLLLQATPRERRLLFEEAAGISRYRVRRDEALRQLGRTEDNLLRLNDIISEIERRVRSVRIQAGRARRYREIEQSLRQCRLRLAWEDLMRLYAQRAEWTFRRDFVAREISRREEDRRRRETEAAEQHAHRRDVEQELSTLRARLENVRAQQVSLGDTAAVTEKRIRELGSTHERWEREAAGARQHLVQYDKEVECLAAECDQAAAAQRAVHTEREERERALAEALEMLQQAEEALSQDRRMLVTILEDLTGLRNTHARTEAEENLARARYDRLMGEAATVARNAALACAEEGAARSRLAAVQAEHKELGAQMQQVVEAVRYEEQGLEKKESQWADTRARIQALGSRRELLDRLLTDLEGATDATRRTIHAARQGELPQVRGLLAELITTAPSTAQAIESALGPWAQAIVVDRAPDLEAVRAFLGPDAAFAAIVLEEVAGGGAVSDAPVGALASGFVGSETVPAIWDHPGDAVGLPASAYDAEGPVVQGDLAAVTSAEESAADPADAPFPCRRAVDVIDFEPELQPVVGVILGKTAIVDDQVWEELTTKRIAGWRVVSTSGALLEPWGGARWGSPAGVLVRRTELIQCEEELSWLGDVESTLSHDVGVRKTHLVQLNERITELSRRQTGLAGRIQALRELLKQIERRKADLALQEEVIAKEQRSLNQELADLRVRRDEVAMALQAQEVDRMAKEEAVTAREEAVRASMEDRRTREARIAELRVHEAAARENTRRVREARDRLLELLRERRRHLEEAERERARTAELTREAEKELADLGKTLEAKRAEESTLAGQLSDAEQSLRNSIDSADAAQQALAEAEGLLEEKRGELSDIQLEERELAVKAEGVVNGVQEEYQIDLAAVARREATCEEVEALSELPPEENLRQKVAELKEKLGRHGNVNLAAIDELKELEDRFSYLAAQRDDLVQARTRLGNVINDLNRKSRRLFSETFDAVNKAFVELFRKAFGGGKAELILEEGADILTAGIEITARPPGKKPSSVRLLSGGERTLTTLVLLFAVLRVRPTPFVVLDEVDAPLDEANVRRFLVLLEEFTDKTQFVLITHNKLTMVKSDSLVGITMEEKGVSKKIAISLRDISDNPDAAGIGN